MTTFLAMYRGETISQAKLIAVSADYNLIAHVSGYLLNGDNPGQTDDVINRLEEGRQSVLRAVRQEATRGRREYENGR